jgi:hypothetical protein
MPQVTIEQNGSNKIFTFHLDQGESISTPQMNETAKSMGASSGDSIVIGLLQRPGHRTQVIQQEMVNGQPYYTARNGPIVTIGPFQNYSGPPDGFSPLWNLIRQDEPETEGGGGVNIGGN